MSTWNTNTAILARLETFSDETAWADLVGHFERPLTRYALRAGLAPSAVADVVQDALLAFAHAYARGAYDRTRGRLSSWLFGIARREVAGARRKFAMHPRASLDDEPELPDRHEEGTLEQIWEEEWRRSVLERCVARVRRELEASTRKCYALQAFDGLTAEEVAVQMSVPITRVYNAKSRVPRRLREYALELEDA